MKENSDVMMTGSGKTEKNWKTFKKNSEKELRPKGPVEGTYSLRSNEETRRDRRTVNSDREETAEVFMTVCSRRIRRGWNKHILTKYDSNDSGWIRRADKRRTRETGYRS